ncbi:unnamed protein product, partial [Meganyctiphanes norvegica]
SFVYFGQMFMSLTPPHWCKPPETVRGYNLSDEEIKMLTIPQNNETGSFSKCTRYDVDYTQVVWNLQLKMPKGAPRAVSMEGGGWRSDISIFNPRRNCDLHWVCDDDWKPTFCQSLFFFGSLVGSPLFGWLADAVGRLPIIITTNVLAGVAGVASSFANDLTTFGALRFMVGMTFDSQLVIVYIMSMEYVSAEYRTIMANVPLMVFMCASMCALPWIALAISNWSTFAIAIHTPQLFFILLFWVIPESARWLISKGRVDDAVTIVRQAGKANQRELSETVISEFRNYCERMKEEKLPETTILDLFKTPVLRRRFILLCIMWMVIVIAYDGHMRNTEHLGDNVFITFTLAGLVEAPADFLLILLVEWLGRRHSTVLTLIGSGIISFIISILDTDNFTVVLAVAMVGRFLITMSLNVGQQYTVEVLPTVARAQGNGAIHTLGFLAIAASPSIVYLSKYALWFPYIIMGVASVAGGLLSIFLPETVNEKLPDSLEDGETFWQDQGLCYDPCHKTYIGRGRLRIRSHQEETHV